MNYHALHTVLSGIYHIDPLQISSYEFLLDALRNGFDFEVDQDKDEFRSYTLDNVMANTVGAGSAPQATKIAVHQQRGIMLKDSMGCGHIGTRELGHRLAQQDANDDVMAQIIIFETGGGASNSPIEIADAIAKCEKPVYAWIDGMCCSAGIYSASYCKEIFAHRSTDWVGSIGTYAEYRGFKSGEKDGQGQYHYRVYATKSDHKNKSYEELIQNGNVTFVKEMVDLHRDRFERDILKNRPKADAKTHCHGDTWEASEVVGPLVDGIKTWEELIDYIVAENSESNSSGGTSSTSISNNKNQNSMKDLIVLAAVLAAAGLHDLELDAEGDLTLNSEQLTALDGALGSHNSTDISAIEKARDDAQAAQTKAEGDLAAANLRIAEMEANSGAKSTVIIPAADGAAADDMSDETPFERFDRLKSENK